MPVSSSRQLSDGVTAGRKRLVQRFWNAQSGPGQLCCRVHVVCYFCGVPPLRGPVIPRRDCYIRRCLPLLRRRNMASGFVLTGCRVRLLGLDDARDLADSIRLHLTAPRPGAYPPAFYEKSSIRRSVAPGAGFLVRTKTGIPDAPNAYRSDNDML